jgi:hypothetical protein
MMAMEKKSTIIFTQPKQLPLFVENNEDGSLQEYHHPRK